MPDYRKMEADCLRIRHEIVDAIHGAGSGHTGGSLSCVEILWTLFSAVMRHRPDDPHWSGRDKFVLSKGHAAPALYTVLGEQGYFDLALLGTLRRTGSKLQGHPDMRKLPGVEMSAGSLGMGISVGVGMALAARLDGSDSRTYVLVGDGEMQEGQNWEALMSANKFKLTNLVVIVDRNGVQLDGTTEEIMPMLDIGDKLRAFGFEVRNCEGHHCESMHEALGWAGQAGDAPRAIVADTVKGKGVSFMEGKNIWHGKAISVEDYATAKRELGGPVQ
jgi:transketolase